MCLAVPMEIIAIDADGTGTVALDAVRFKVGLILVEDPQIGEYVLVHAGYAIEKLDTAEADARLALFRTLAEIHHAQTGSEVTLVAPPRYSGGET
ncbi:MAG: hypC [Magnetococcales bacterium]|nr:hypC [Magnetococcales bacterium]HIJ84187.1 HypC/HybG/HupF family hydrogenase formation chaperone [Magnetococcales bacterium]